MPYPQSDLAPIIGPAPPTPAAAAASHLPWEVGLVGLALALVLAWLALRLNSPYRQLRWLSRAAASEDPRQVAHGLAKLMEGRHRLRHVSSASCPAGVSPAAWRAWVTDLDAIRFGADRGGRDLLAQVCRDAQDLMARR